MYKTSEVQERKGSGAVRPPAVTIIAVLELAAAAWDGQLFLHQDSLAAVSWGSPFALHLLMPALMAIAAIYGGVGLLKMRRDAWTVWMLRHAWLGALYLLTLPSLAANSLWCPALQAILTWQLTIVIFSIAAGSYLLSVRSRFNMGNTR